jgi:CHAT domain-containing protein
MAKPKWMHRGKWLVLGFVTALLCICVPPAVRYGSSQAIAHLPQFNNSVITAIADRENSTQPTLQEVRDLQARGHYHYATKKLMAALQIDFDLFNAILRDEASEQLPNYFTKNLSRTELEAWRTLGDLLRVTGALNNSEQILQYSLGKSQTMDWQKEIAANWVSLGNTRRAIAFRELSLENIDDAQNTYQQAVANYQQALQETATQKNHLIYLQARLNLLNLFAEKPTEFDRQNAITSSQVKNLQQTVRNQLEALSPTSDRAIAARIDFARTLTCLKLQTDNTVAVGEEGNIYQPPIVRRCSHSQSQFQKNDVLASWQEIAKLISIAAQNAKGHGKEIRNPRLFSYALGYLGQLYELQKQWSDAEELTNRAMSLAQSRQAWDIAYHWQWQQGRLQILQGNRKKAIEAYTAAYNSLQDIRQDLAILNEDVQFNFREEIEPVYRELVDLLLKEESPGEKRLEQARQVIDALQVAELNDFFRDRCAELKEVELEKIDPHAGVFYAMVLPNRESPQRVEVILDLPEEPLYHYERSPSSLLDDIEFLKGFLAQPPRKGGTFNEQAQSILQGTYQWFFQEADEKIAASQTKVKTLVFVLDSVLQDLPVAALHDGEKYFIEKYPISVTPSLRLLEPQRITWDNLHILGNGRSNFSNLENDNWNDLPYVKEEIQNIESQFPRQTEPLLNQDFTTNNLNEKVNNSFFPIVHIATHGKFSSQAENTFIFAWDGKIKIEDLGRLLRINDPTRLNDIELLVLSACQTAQGNDRTTLGMAGTALQARARSIIASSWVVNDRSTVNLMEHFYRSLKTTLQENESTSKARLLQQAQVALLKGEYGEEYTRPHFWAPFVLVGNWL